MSNSALIEKGQQRIAWAGRRMPVVRAIAESWRQTQPLANTRIGACLHVTTETANLVLALRTAGAEVALCGSNPLSTQDEVVEALNQLDGIHVFAKRGDVSGYYGSIAQVINRKPDLVMDDGADLIKVLHAEHPHDLPRIIAGTEETTTGVNRLRAMQEDQALRFPVIAVNQALTKHLFDNRYGTGQSTFDGILRATNVLVAGKTVVVVGYGWCGRGVARRAEGMGARVFVVEVDALRALEAVMDGYWVTDMRTAAREGDIFITVTGNTKAIGGEHFPLMKDGAMLCNSGHFNVEIDIDVLEEQGVKQSVGEYIDEYLLSNGRRIFVIAQGRLVNLVAAEGHPAEVMDMSFANQALVLAWLVDESPSLDAVVYPVPAVIDQKVARLKLEAMGIRLEQLSPEQIEYMNSWKAGTDA